MGSNMDKIYIVMNYVEHDLKSLMETMKQPFLPGRAGVPVRTARPRGWGEHRPLRGGGRAGGAAPAGRLSARCPQAR